MHVIQCAIGNERYAFDMSWVRTIQRTGTLLMSPQTKSEDAGFVGWLSSNEGDIPVFDMAHRLQRPFSMVVNSPQQRILILPAPTPTTPGWTAQGQPWGLLVDQVSQVLEISGDSFAPLPAIAANPQTNFFEGVIKLDDRLLLFLSPEWLHPDMSPPSNGKDGSAVTTNELPALDHFTPQPQNTATNGKSRNSGRLMICSTGDQLPSTERPIRYGFSVIQIVEIINPTPATPVPTAPPYVLGLINWRNRPVPVVDLPQRIGLAPSLNNTYSRYAVVHDGIGNFGCIPINADVRVVQLPIKHRPSSRPLPFNRKLAYGTFELDQETLIIPNIKQILSRQ